MRPAILVSLVLALSACDSGGSSSFTDPGSSGGAAGGAAASPFGIWDGTIKEGPTTINAISCLAAKNGRIACIFTDPQNGALAGAGIGTVNGSGDNVTISGTSFTTPGYAFADGSHVSTISGTQLKATERATLTGTASIAGHVYAFNTAFNSLYDHDSSLAAIAGVYQSFAINGDVASLSIDANGVLFSQSQAGCIASGTVSVIDPTLNGYSVALQVSSCGALNGMYSGLAIADAADSRFTFAVFNSLGGVVGSSVK